MTDDPLIGPRLKIERAYGHILDVKRSLEAFLQRQPYITLTEPNADGTKTVIKARRVHQLSPVVGLVVSDAIHNLRSTLDLLMCCMATKNGFTDMSGVHFPFGKTQQTFETAVNEGKVRSKIGPDAIALIKELKPYKGGNDVLWALHDLDRIDKHISLITVGIARIGHAASGMFRPQSAGLVTVSAPTQWNTLEEETILMEITNFGEGDFQAEFTVDVAFGDIEPVQRKPVLAVLQDFANLVTRIFSTFEYRFFKT